jgi:hypothetical protein
MVSNESVGVAISDKNDKNTVINDYGGCNSFLKRQAKATAGYKSHLFFPIKTTMFDHHVHLFATLLSRLTVSKSKTPYFNWKFRIVDSLDKPKDDVAKKIRTKIGDKFSVLIVEIPTVDTGKGFTMLLYASFMRMFTQLAYEASNPHIGYPLAGIQSSNIGSNDTKYYWDIMKRVLNIAHSYPVMIIDRTPVIGDAITADGESLFYTPFICNPQVTFDMFIKKFENVQNYRMAFSSLMTGLILQPSVKLDYQISIKTASYIRDNKTISSFIHMNEVPVVVREKILCSTITGNASLVSIYSSYTTKLVKNNLPSAILSALEDTIVDGAVAEGTRIKVPRLQDAFTTYCSPVPISSTSKLIKFKMYSPGRNTGCQFSVIRVSKTDAPNAVKRSINGWYGSTSGSNPIDSVKVMMRSLLGRSDDENINNKVLEHMLNEYTK